ncbi:phage major capsid protein, partial [Bacillus licheniformis]
MRNQEIIRKAEMSLATLKSGGLMNPAQASAFIRMVQNTPTIFSESRVIQMENDSQKFEKIGFGQRILRAADEGKALAKDQLTAPVTSTVELNAKEVIAEVNITYDTLENNIEKDGLQQTLMQMLAERAAVDIEELIVNGDVASSDPYLAQLDGIRKQSVSHIVDAGGEQISRQLFKQ